MEGEKDLYKIILVDDEPWSIIGMQKIFLWQENGFEVVGTANDAYMAISLIKELRPDVVFTDIRMPEMSGLELIEQVKSYGINCEFIVISGFAEFQYAQQALRLSVLDYIIKPISFKSADLLLKRLQVHLDKKYKDDDYLSMEQLSTIPGVVKEVCSKRGIDLVPQQLRVTAVWGESFEPSTISIGNEVLCLRVGCKYGIPVYMLLHNSSLSFSQVVTGISICDDFEDVPKAIKTAVFSLYTALFIGYSNYCCDINGKGRHNNRLEFWINHLAKVVMSGDRTLLLTFLKELPDIFVNENFDLRDVIQIINHAILLTGDKKAEIFLDIDSITDEFINFQMACDFLYNMFYDDNEDEGSVNESFLKLRGHVNEHFTDSLSLSELASRYFLNFSYASSLFKKTTGKTFSQYLTELRMNHARQLLSNPDLNISEIGELCGYEDSYYFNKVFKKHHGVPPSAYRSLPKMQNELDAKEDCW